MTGASDRNPSIDTGPNAARRPLAAAQPATSVDSGLGLAKGAVNGDLGQGALENRELLVVQIRDE